MLLENKKKIISVILVIALIVGFVIYMVINNQEDKTIDLNTILVEQNNTIDNQIEKENLEEEESIQEIVIHITGEVKKEGVVYLKEGSRVVDAIQEAGGETKEADLSQVNLAYVLQDGEKIYIPNKNEKVSKNIEYTMGGNSNVTDKKEEREEEKVNINTSSEEELDQLPGIGPATARKIIDYRNEHGKFGKIEDIKNVKGIGDAKYNDIKDCITV